VPERNTIEIQIKADDKASSVLKEVGASTNGLGKLLGGLGKVAGVGIGIATGVITGLGAALGSTIGPAMEAQQVEAQLDQVLKSTGGAAGMSKEAIIGLANSLSMLTPFEDEAIISAETLLLQFKNIGSDVFPQATEMTLDLAQRLGIDLPSAAKLLGKALETPGEGLLRLKQAGVAFSDEQEAMIMKMAEAGDMAGAQKLILDELALSVGGAARAAGETAAGKFEILKNTFGNIKEEIGTALLPTLTQLADSLLSAIADPRFQKAIQDLSNWLVTNLPIAIQALAEYWSTTLYPALQQVWTFITTSLVPALTSIYNWFVAYILPAIEDQIAKWKTFATGMQAVAAFITGTLIPAFNDIVNGATRWVKDLGAKFTTLIDDIKTIGANIVAGIKKGIEDAWDAFIDWILGKMGNIIQAIADFLGIQSPSRVMAKMGRDMMAGLAQGIGDGVNVPVRTMLRGGAAVAGAAAGGLSTGGAPVPHGFGVQGDIYYISVTDRLAAAMLLSNVRDRQQRRLAVGMGA
jgi:phage-related protein